MSGGIDARALEIRASFLPTARNTEEAGLAHDRRNRVIETGSRMDELIFQSSKAPEHGARCSTAKVSDLRIYPAIDIFKSGTPPRRAAATARSASQINVIRRGLSGHKPEEAIERLLMFVKKFPTNARC